MIFISSIQRHEIRRWPSDISGTVGALQQQLGYSCFLRRCMVA